MSSLGPGERRRGRESHCVPSHLSETPGGRPLLSQAWVSMSPDLPGMMASPSPTPAGCPGAPSLLLMAQEAPRPLPEETPVSVTPGVGAQLPCPCSSGSEVTAANRCFPSESTSCLHSARELQGRGAEVKRSSVGSPGGAGASQMFNIIRAHLPRLRWSALHGPK